MKMQIEVEGFKDLDNALAELPKATARNALQRALMEVAQPIADDAKARAPVDTGLLRRRIEVSKRLSKRQARLNRRSEDKSFAEVHVGPPSSSDIARMVEFGTSDAPAQPYLRPAWDAGWRKALDGMKEAIAAEIENARKRLARKAERLAAKQMKRP
jgi:HK97 gp10 family phage protein